MLFSKLPGSPKLPSYSTTLVSGANNATSKNINAEKSWGTIPSWCSYRSKQYLTKWLRLKWAHWQTILYKNGWFVGIINCLIVSLRQDHGSYEDETEEFDDIGGEEIQ